MNQINIATKKFTDAVKIDIGQLPVTDVKIDFNLTDGSKPVIAENKTFTLTIGTVQGELYKTDDDTVSYRYLKFDDSNVANSLAITMKMNGEEILNDTVSLTYQTSGGFDTSILDKKLDAPVTPGTVGQVLTKTADGQKWDDAQGNINYFFLEATGGDRTVRLDKIGNAPEINLEYSTDKVNWTEYTWNGNTGATINIQNGHKVFFRGNNERLGSSTSAYHKFVMSGNCYFGGNLLTLLSHDGVFPFIPSYAFFSLFEGTILEMGTLATYLLSVHATFANSMSFGYTFQNSGLFSYNEKPKQGFDFKIGAFYSNTFDHAFANTRIVIAPNINDGYYPPAPYMFENCTKLVSIRNTFDSDVYDNSSDGYCKGCTSLKTADLYMSPNKGLGYGANSWFEGCTSLEKIIIHKTPWTFPFPNWLKNASTTGIISLPKGTSISTRTTDTVPPGWTIVYTDDTAVSGTAMNVSTSSDATVELSPSGDVAKQIAVSSALTLSASSTSAMQIAYAEIVLDVATGATVTAGTNMTLVDTPTAGKRNICVCRWSGGVCKLYVTIVEDLPQA